MASNFPASLDTGSTTLRDDIQSNDDLNTAGKEHDVMHVNVNDSSIELQKKLGIGASNAASAAVNTILTHTGSGTTAWSNTITGSTIAGTTFSGAVVGGDQVMSAVTHKDYSETVHAGGNTGATPAIDEANGNTQSHTLNAATVTFALPADAGLQAGTALTLIISQDGSGSRAAVFQVSGATTNVKWAGGAAPTISTAASAVDIVTFVTANGGASPVWYGFLAGQAFA